MEKKEKETTKIIKLRFKLRCSHTGERVYLQNARIIFFLLLINKLIDYIIHINILYSLTL